MKVIDKRSGNKPYKTATQLAADFPVGGRPDEIRSFIVSIFDSCIAVVQERADEEAIVNRYREEQVRGAQRMAESIVKQLKALRG